VSRAGSLRWTEDEWREHCLRRHAEVNSVAAPRRQPRGGIVERVYERDVLKGVLQALELHPKVAWAARMNVGGMQDSHGNHVRFGFRGLSDVVGMLRDGRFLAVEVKRPGGQPTTAQVEFLGLVSRSGGVAFVARSVEDVMRGLADA